MSKVYDRVEWYYLKNVMDVMEFKPNLIELIMKCVSSALVNGTRKSHIVPSRELRQGDPLSPYIFLLCNKGLICLLNKLARELQIPRIKVGRGAPSINYLLFIDDNVIFYKADVGTTRKIQQVVEVYEKAFGQCIKSNKTTMVFGKNTPTRTREELISHWTNDTLQQHEKYFNLPPMIGKSKRKAFSKIKDRV